MIQSYTAYVHGQRDYRTGLDERDNPYSAGPLAQAWRLGWYSACIAGATCAAA